MMLAPPPPRYDQSYVVKTNQAVQQEDLRNRKKGTDVELGVGERVVLRSPNGARWSITVSNTGVVSAVAL